MTTVPIQQRRDNPTLMAVGLILLLAIPAAAAYAGTEGNLSESTISLLVLVPLVAVISMGIVDCERKHGVWLAGFAAITLPQVGHLGEHVGQMVQVHGLGLAPPQAHGAVGVLDLEWVHLLWNVGVLVGVMILLMKFRSNPWLKVTAAVGLLHAVEHIVIMSTFLQTGKPGDPGLLAKGGDIGGGIGLIRPDLHFIYSLLMTAPLVAAFIWQLRKDGARFRRPRGGGGKPVGAAGRA